MQLICDVYDLTNNSDLLGAAERQTLRVVYKEDGSLIKILSPKVERQLFGLQIVAAILNHGRFNMQKLLKNILMETSMLYDLTKKNQVEFYQYAEFIEAQIQRILFDRDIAFKEIEK